MSVLVFSSQNSDKQQLSVSILVVTLHAVMCSRKRTRSYILKYIPTQFVITCRDFQSQCVTNSSNVAEVIHSIGHFTIEYFIAKPLTWNEQGLYRNKVTHSLIPVQRFGNQAHSCKRE